MKKWLAILATFVLVFAMTTTAFAAEVETPNTYKYNGIELPEFTQYNDETYPYLLLYQQSEQYWMVESDTPFVKTSTGAIRFTDKASYRLYFISNTTGDWSMSGGEMTGPANMNFKDDANTVKWASHQILNEDGDSFMEGDPNFFPLVELMAKVTEKAMTETAVPQMMKDLTTLIPMGVGLMALLIGLPLFGKVLLRFLS